MTGVEEMVAAAAHQPRGTLMLRSDRLTPAELADEVLAAAGLRRFTKTASGCGRQDRWTQKLPKVCRASCSEARPNHIDRGSCRGQPVTSGRRAAIMWPP